MPVTLTSPVTGAAQTDLTSPAFTLTEDTKPDVNAIQYVVSQLGGTQTGVETHTASNPFTISVFKPKNVKVRTNPDANGIYRNIPFNTTKLHVRKGVSVGNTVKQVDLYSVTLKSHAGADVEDPESIRSALSLLIGALSQVSASLGDQLVNGY